MRKATAKIRKTLSIVLATAMVTLIMPVAFADSTGTVFDTYASANHWGRSDIRSYMNKGLMDGSMKIYAVDSTTSGTNGGGEYESHFNKGELALVQPSTVETNVLNIDATNVYETTDKFFLPSGNYNNFKVISWGKEDISSGGIYANQVFTNSNIGRMIPISYWASMCNNSAYYSWLRSPNYRNSYTPLSAFRGYCVDLRVAFNSNPFLAAVFRINLKSVIFSSAVSAANLCADGVDSRAAKFEVSNVNLGQITEKTTGDYGMYLKKKMAADEKFKVSSIKYNSLNNTITVSYSGGVKGNYITICAFGNDNFNDSQIISYGAAKKIGSEGSETLEINLSDFDSPDLSDLTFKIWMEDEGTDGIAATTIPETWEYDGIKFNANVETATHANNRVFANKDALKCSWGNITNGPELYGNELPVCENPTNQKIYFGSYDNKPMQFWIAGREGSDGELNNTGDIMCLYQVKAVEKVPFNSSIKPYVPTTLKLVDSNSVGHIAGDAPVQYSGMIEYKYSLGKKMHTATPPTLQYQYCSESDYKGDETTSWTNGMPSEKGEYRIRAIAPRHEDVNYEYERSTSASVKFTVDDCTKGHRIV